MPCVAIDMFSKFLGHIPKINKQLRKFSLSHLMMSLKKISQFPTPIKHLLLIKIIIAT